MIRRKDAQVSDTISRLQNRNDPDMLAGYARAGEIYAVFLRQRFRKASAGDGTWRDLAPRTKLNRLRTSRTIRNKAAFRKASRLVRDAVHFGITTRKRAIAAAVTGVHLPILYDSGRLFNGLYIGSPDNIYTVTATKVVIGVDVPYGEFHHKGTSKMPARKFIVPADKQTMTAMKDAIRIGYTKAVRKALRGS